MKKLRLNFISILLVFNTLIIFHPSQLNAQIYYSANEEIRVVPVGGVQSEFLLEADAYGLAIDAVEEHIYWSEWAVFGSEIKRAALDGSNITVINDQSSAVRGLTLDLQNEKLYWVDLNNDGEILRSDLNGDNAEVLIAGESDGDTDGILDIALDLENSKMYWVKLGAVMRADLEGENIEVAVEITSFVQPTSVDVNPRDGFVYWVDTSNDNIMRADTETGNASTFIRADEPSGISIDVENDLIFWIDDFFLEGTGQLSVANLDGSDPEVINTTGFTRGAISAFDWQITTSNEMDAELPSAFQLNQNYPNPFNPSTVIEYHLPSASRVSVTVYNAAGKQVTILADNILQNAGTQGLTFDASGLTSGVYFYRLNAGNYSITRKMTLLK